MQKHRTFKPDFRVRVILPVLTRENRLRNVAENIGSAIH